MKERKSYWIEMHPERNSLVLAIDWINKARTSNAAAVFKNIACHLIEHNCPYFPVKLKDPDSSWEADLLSYAVHSFTWARHDYQKDAHLVIIDLLVKKGHKPLAPSFKFIEVCNEKTVKLFLDYDWPIVQQNLVYASKKTIQLLHEKRPPTKFLSKKRIVQAAVVSCIFAAATWAYYKFWR